MADRFPLILNTSNNQIQEIASGDNLDLTGSGISNAGIITAGNVTIGAATTDLIVTGDARVTGILTIGTSSLKLDGPNNLVNVGTALTLGHTQGLQFHTQNLHSAGFEVNQINTSGIATFNEARLGNSKRLKFGDDIDLQIYHFPAGSGNNYISAANNTGIVVSAQNVSLMNQNHSAYFFKGEAAGSIVYHNNTARVTTTSTGINVAGNNVVSGNVTAVDGTFTGNVSVGGTLTYEDVTNIDSVGIITAREGVFLPDLKQLKLGNTAAAPDLYIWHNSSTGNSNISNKTGDLFIQGNNGSGTVVNQIAVKSNAAVELNYQGNKKFETTATGIKVSSPSANPDIKIYGANGSGAEHRIFSAGSNSESLQITANSRLFLNGDDINFRNTATTVDLFTITSNGDVNLPRDSKKIQIGAGQDLELFHNGSNTFIRNNTGYLVLSSENGSTYYDADNHYFRKADSSEYMGKFMQDSAVELYHDGTKKFETSSTGATVTGALSVTGDITVPTSMDSTTTGGVGIQRFWTASISAGSVYKCGQWYTTEGTVQLLINVRSFQPGHSGTSTYMFQGGFSAIGSTGTVRLLPLTSGNGHGNGPDTGENSNAWEVLIDNINNYTYAVYVHVPSGVNAKGIYITVTELTRGTTFTDLSSTVAYSSISSEVQANPHYSLRTSHISKLYAPTIYNDSQQYWRNSSGTNQMFTLSNNAGFNFQDNIKAEFGASGDLKIYHDGSNNQLNYSNGNLLIRQGSHTSSQCLQFDGNGHLYVPDNEMIYFGSGADLKIYHDGTDNIFQSSGLKNFVFKPKDTDIGLKIKGDNGVELYYDNAKHFETTSFGSQTVFSSGNGTTPIFKILHGNLTQGLGLGYHGITATGSNSNVELRIQPKGTFPVYIQRDNGAAMLRANPGAELILYHNGEETAQTYNTNGRKAFLVGDKDHINSGVTHGELIVRKNLSSPNNASISQCARITVMTNEQTAGGNGYGGAVYFMGQDVSTSNQYAEYAAIGAKMHGSGDLANTTPNCDFSIFTRNGSSFPERFRVKFDGTIYAVNTTVQSLSDIRLKENIEDYSFDLNKFKQFKPVTFNWKKPEYHSETPKSGKHRGFIAQDVQKLDSYALVNEYDLDKDSEERELIDEDGVGLTSTLGDKDAMYVSVIQQMIDKIEKLETEVASLKGS